MAESFSFTTKLVGSATFGVGAVFNMYLAGRAGQRADDLQAFGVELPDGYGLAEPAHIFLGLICLLCAGVIALSPTRR